MKLPRSAAAGLLGALFICAAWRPLLLEGKVPVDGNMIALSFPHWAMMRSLWERPRLPLWNPARNLGEPHLADPQTLALYPPMWALSALPGFADFLRLWVVLHAALAAVFMALLARRWGAPPGGWAAAGAVAALNGFFCARVTFLNHYAAAAWLPAVLYFQARGSVAGLGVTLALQWYAGFPPFLLLTALAALALAWAQGGDAPRRFAKGAALGAAFAAPGWLPFLELVAYSARGALLSPEAAVQYSLPPAQLLKELLLPQWYALSPSLAGDPAIVAFYVGPAVLALCAWGAAKGGRGERLVAAAAGAALLLSLGGHLPGYRWLAPLRVFRFPANWLLLAAAAAAPLCAAGIAFLPPRRRWPAAAFVAFDLLLFAQFPRAAWALPQFLTELPALAARLLEGGGPRRIYHAEPLMAAWRRGSLESAADYALMRELLAPSYGTAFGVQEASSYQTLGTRAAARWRERVEREGPDSELLRVAGVAAIVTLAGPAERVTAANARVYPRAAGPRLFATEGNPELELLEYREGRVRARVLASGPSRVALAETDYPGWRAYLDGRRVPSWRHEDIFPAVEVPPGEHELEFRFGSPPFWLGLAVCAAGLLALAVKTRELRTR